MKIFSNVRMVHLYLFNFYVTKRFVLPCMSVMTMDGILQVHHD